MQVERNISFGNIPLKQCNTEAGDSGTASNLATKNKSRRYWTQAEEDTFFILWGRDNWRLTKNGKNTITFAKWSTELRDHFGIDIKPEEVQTKVNQTRAKFRQVKKQMMSDVNARKWKKYEIIEKILRNEYRPKNAEPIPPEALENNRDLPLMDTTKTCSPSKYSPNSHTSIQEQNGAIVASDVVEENEMNDFDEHMYNAAYEVKNEHQYSYQYQPQQNYTQQDYQALESVQQFEETPYEQQTQTEEMRIPMLHPQELLERHIQQLQQEQSHQIQTVEQYHNTTADNALEVNNISSDMPADVVQHSELINSLPKAAESKNNSLDELGNSTQPTDKTLEKKQTIQELPGTSKNHTANSRKRRLVTNDNVANGSSMDELYLEEIRRKNAILEERKDISRQLLEIEQRKVSLIETFMPKFLDMQNKIWSKLNS